MARSLPRFTADRWLGSGATSRVQRARLERRWRDLPAGTELALKRPLEDRAEDPRVLEAFAREARVLGRVSGPGIVTLVAEGRDEHGPWLLEQLVPGPTLAEELRGGVPEEARVRRLGADLAAGLAALHAAGWCHGDVKPENARLDGSGRALWIDLGLARPVDAPAGSAPQGGNLAYLSPEEARGEARTPASEVFALGVLLHELATGVHPLTRVAGAEGSGTREEDRHDELLFALAEPHLPLPSELRPELSPLLDQLLAAALCLWPAERPTMLELAAALDQGEGGSWWFERRRATPRASAGAPDWPLVGREEQLALLAEASSAAIEAAGGALVLEGESGVGKTRLVREAMPRLRVARDPEPPLVLATSCTAWEVERPAQPVRSLLGQWLGLPREREPGPRERERLERLVRPEVAATLARALSPHSDESTEMAVPAALAEWWLALAAERPLVVVLDDLRSAGEVTLEIVERVAAQLASTRCLLVCVLRAHSIARHPVLLQRCLDRLRGPEGTEPAPRLVVPPLTQPDVGRLVEALFAPTSPRLRLGRVLFERSEGNPGQLVELLRTMTHRGQVHRGGPGLPFHLTGRPEDVPRARSLATAISASYRALPEEDREWLARLAVVGGTLEPGFLERAFAPERRAEVEALLARLVGQGWLVVAGRRYRFARQAVREAVLHALGPARRRELHGVAADALRPGADGGPPLLTTAYQRAYHLRAAGRDGELLDFLPGLVRQALERGHPQRVHSLCAWGLEALDRIGERPGSSELRIELLEAAADSADRLGRRDAQREWLDRLSDLDLDPDQDPVGAGRVYLLHARHAAGTGRYGLARGLFLNAGQLFARGRAADLESEAWRRMAHVQSHLGELEQAGELARRAYQVAVAPHVQSMAAVAQSLIDLLEDRYESALRHVDRARRLVRGRSGLRERGPLAAASLMRARIYRVVGRPGRALAAVQHAARLARQAGERRLEIEALARLGALWIDVDREDEAESRLRDALLSATEIEDGRAEALACLWLGTLLSERESPEGAHLIERSTRVARRLGLGRVVTVGLALQARVALARRDVEGALARSQEAMEALERFGAELPDRVVVVATRALALRRGGRDEEAETLDTELGRTVRRVNQRIHNTVLRREHGEAARRAFAAASTEIGYLTPRTLSDTGIFELRREDPRPPR